MTEHHTPSISNEWLYFERLLHVRFWTILTFFTLTLLITVIGTSLQTPVYEATSTVFIDMESPNVLAVSTSRDDSTVGQTNYMTYADYYRTQLEVIKSRAVAEQVFVNLRLNEQSQYANQKDPIAKLLGAVKVEPVKQTRLAKIHIEDPSSKQAARIANEFALVFVEQNLTKAATAETMTLMKNEYLKLQSKEAELSKRYKPKFPTMVRVHQQMDQLSRSIEEEMKRQLHYERYQAEGSGAPEGQEIQKSFMEQIRKGPMVSGLRPNNIRFQDLAQAPTRPSKPNAKLNFLLGIFLGLVGGLGAAVVEELLDSSLKFPEDIEREKQFLLLGNIPSFDGLNDGSKGSLRDRYQYVHKGPDSQAAEAYRALRTNLIYAAPQTSSQTVIVTSPGSEEGKTTTIANLGIILAHTGLKILLVDADLRKPRLHEAFAVKQKPGLSEFLIGQATLEKIIQPTAISGLWVVASGASPPNPSELLGLPQMKEFLNQVAAKFDRVLLDTPPIIAVTDAVILAAIVGRVLAVAQSGKTPRLALHRLSSMVQEVQAKVLGIILNNVSPRYAGTSYGYSRYQYGYGKPGNPPNNKQSYQNTLQRLSKILKRVREKIRPISSREEAKSRNRSAGPNAKAR